MCFGEIGLCRDSATVGIDGFLEVTAGDLRIAETEQRARIAGRRGTQRVCHQRIERNAVKSVRSGLFERAQRFRRLSGFEQRARVGQPIERFAWARIARGFEMRHAFGNGAAALATPQDLHGQG